MKELIIECSTNPERISIICLLYGYGYNYNEQTVKEVLDSLVEGDGYDNILLSPSEDGPYIDFANDDYVNQNCDEAECIDSAYTEDIVDFLNKINGKENDSVDVYLTPEYNATVSKEGIEVGCQFIPWCSFDILVETTKRFR